MKKSSRPGRARLIQGMLAACSLVVCSPTLAQAQANNVPATDREDPYEGFNRKTFELNQSIDRGVLRPAAIGYKRILPGPLRRGLANAISNLGEPSIFINEVLQGHGKKATRTLARFAGNTTLGLAGLFDVATGAGLPHHGNDFGITLAHYGAGPGPYLFIPLAGPTTVRDGIGNIVGIFLNPLFYARYSGDLAVGVTTAVAGGLQARADADRELMALEGSATDTYASYRSYFLQNRQAEVTGGKLDVQALPDFGDQPAARAETPPMQPPASPHP